MPRQRKPAFFALLALCLLPASSAFAFKIERLARVSPASGKTSSLEVVSGSAMVRFRAGVSTSTALAALEPFGYKILSTFDRFNWSVVSFPEGAGVAAALGALAAQPGVEWAEPNRVYKPRRVPNDPYLGSQYALSAVQAFGAWEFETGASSRATVALIDTGIDGSHPELSGKLTGTSRQFNPTSGAASNNQPPTPACNHATRAAGVAAAATDNGAGMAGMTWGGKLVSLKVFSDANCFDDCSDESGFCATSETSIAAAIDDIVPKHNTAAYGKIVVNISLGSVGSCSTPLQNSVDAAVAAGLMIFSAAGNEGYGAIDSPANCNNVYAVGATDSKDVIASFSNADTLMITKGLAAPGVGVYTTDIGNAYASATGTSFSSPMAAGLAALVWSAKPSFTNTQVFDAMKNSADDLGPSGPDRDYGWGRINAMKALRLAVTGTKQFAGTAKAVAYPNPFNPKTQKLVTFTVPEAMAASGTEVKVYTSEGELVRKLDSLAWDGRNEAGVLVASGVYIFRVKTSKDSAVGRFALLK
ncbi:MAG: S8 family serine peptidase [Elusimicrobia bacterium]|nr:S8 family serine peptidase [Elusimicrobiota bacterium]